jgi:Ca2+-binding RTX toxin-like protein
MSRAFLKDLVRGTRCRNHKSTVDWLGGAGNDTPIGGNGSNKLIVGPGRDVLDGGPCDNILVH